MNQRDEMECPVEVTTIDQHRGIHAATGLTMTQLTDVRTSYSELCDESWESQDAESRAYWSALVADCHAAAVELASLPADHRADAQAALDQACRHGCSADDIAGYTRSAIEQTAPADLA